MRFPATAAALLVLTPAVMAVSPAISPAEQVAAAHGRENVPADAVLRASITVEFGGNALLDAAELTFHPNGGLVRIETDDATAVFDGTTAHLSPPDAEMARPRFQLLTWPYFALMPFKLDDGGANLAEIDDAPLREGGEPMPRMRLTFGQGVGDSPDDWYVLYLDGSLLKAASYIVTYGDVDPDAAEPHAIVYDDIENVPGPDGRPTGVLISRSWTFHNWSEDEGITGEPIGRATLEDLRFVERESGMFEAPADAREVEVPAGDAENG